MRVYIKDWQATAPGLASKDDWKGWLASRYSLDQASVEIDLKAVKPMLRRRFTQLGKLAATGLTQLLSEQQATPCIFASRHGDTPLTLGLLEEIARDQPLSPTQFGLSVHNAIAGLVSIARADHSPISAISAMHNLVPSTLLEAAGLLQTHSQVACVLYDLPLPQIYQHQDLELAQLPTAICLLLTQQPSQMALTLEPAASIEPPSYSGPFYSEFQQLIQLLCHEQQQHFTAASTGWIISSQQL